MDIGEFNIKNLGNSLNENKVLSRFVSSFIDELKDYLEKGDRRNKMEEVNKYSNYWDYQNCIEENVSARIGLSRWGNDNTYYDELNQIVDDIILEISKEETVYRKQFPAVGNDFEVEKFENGEITNLKLPKEIISEEYYNKDIIFQYDGIGNAKIRDDLKERIIELSKDKAYTLKNKEKEKNIEYKKEGHIYEAYEDDGYIFLNDLTEEMDFSIEDIDFIVDNYEGDGKYQVVNGEYIKINE